MGWGNNTVVSVSVREAGRPASRQARSDLLHNENLRNMSKRIFLGQNMHNVTAVAALSLTFAVHVNVRLH